MHYASTPYFRRRHQFSVYRTTLMLRSVLARFDAHFIIIRLVPRFII